MTGPVLELTGISKQYGALRPLRIERLVIESGEQVVLLGLDQPAAEVLINLLTGASLPDTGHIHTFGRSTADIADSADWLSMIDRFGIVSERAALLEPLSTIQNLAMPFTLEIEPPADDVARRASRLAAEAGLSEPEWTRRVGDLGPASRMRVRLARALAFDPYILLLEHPSASLPRHEASPFARQVRQVADTRRTTVLTLTADGDYAAATRARVLQLEAATGRLRRV